MATDLVRTNCVYRYRLIPNRAQTVTLEVSVSYVVQNFASSPREHVPRVALEKIDRPTIIEVGCHSPDRASAYFLSGADLTVLEDRPGIVRADGRPILVQPRANGIEYRVFAKWSYLMPEAHTDIMAFVGPTTGATVEADYPQEFAFVAQGATVQTGDRVWEYRRLFLPRQHIRVRWWRKDSDTPVPDTTPPNYALEPTAQGN